MIKTASPRTHGIKQLKPRLLFSVSAPSVWNSLSYNCRSAELLSTFKRSLKTQLFDMQAS